MTATATATESNYATMNRVALYHAVMSMEIEFAETLVMPDGLAEAREILMDRIADKPAKPTYKVRWVDTVNIDTKHGEAVQVHGAECQHLDKFRGDMFTPISDVEEWASAQDFFHDYNADFYAEDGDAGCWPIRFYPCSGMVTKQTTITAMAKSN